MTDQATTMRHTENKIDSTHAAHHIVSAKTYMVVFSSLLFLTIATVVVAYINLGGLLNLVAALGIATVKGTIVTLYFMHVRYSGRLIQIVIVTALLFLALMLFGTLMDVWTRNNVTPAGYLEDYEYNKTALQDNIHGSDRLEH